MMAAQLLSPTHADPLKELLIVAENRQFFFSTILQDLSKQHQSDWSSTAANELSQRYQEIWIRKLIILHLEAPNLVKGATWGASDGFDSADQQLCCSSGAVSGGSNCHDFPCGRRLLPQDHGLRRSRWARIRPLPHSGPGNR